MILFTLLCFLLCFSPSKAGYDYDMGLNSLVHAENAYCDPSTYLTREYTKAPLRGFVGTYHIQGDKDTEGYVGYTTAQSAIYVSFRGTSDPANWATNLDIVTTSYPFCTDCKVHKGFYKAEQSVIANITDQVEQLTAKYPDYSVVVTGHSLGAALATLTILDLQNAGVKNLRLFNYGSPRIFNKKGAEYASSAISDRNRVTHHKDMVVHVPTSVRFEHISGEWYEADDQAVVVSCVGYEDPNCSYQWDITSISDHLYYMGYAMGSSGCSAI